MTTGVTVVRRDQIPDRELVGADWGGVDASLIFVDAEPGHGPDLHTHAYAELFIVLEGQATISGADEAIVLEAGDVAIVAAGQPHGFKNTGTGRLRQIDIHLSATFATDWL
jgi:mannose-6-phosphate isomerase-like protein (cupin superfamily)